MMFIGLMPIGSLIMGAVADQLGPLKTIRIGSACCVVGSIFVLRRFAMTKMAQAPIQEAANVSEAN